MATDTDTNVSQDDLVHLHRLATSYLSSRALFSALELGVFDSLQGAGAATPEELAQRLGLGERAARVILLALAGDHILAREGDHYRNTALAEAYLVSSSPGFYGGFTNHQAQHFAKFARLTEALRNNGPLAAHPVAPGTDGGRPQRPAGGGIPEALARSWAEASNASALLQADGLAATARLAPGRRLVDLGCGGGSYSLALARANPDVTVTGVEQPALVAIVRARFEAAGLGTRLQVRSGNIFADEFPDHDVALLSHVLDGHNRDSCEALIRHIHGWLPDGGELLVHAHFPSRASVPFPSQLGLILLVNNPHGGEVHDEALTCRWLEDAGFGITEVAEVSPISSLVRATKGAKARSR